MTDIGSSERDGWGTACSIFSPTVAFSVIRLLIVLHEPLCRDLMSLTFRPVSHHQEEIETGLSVGPVCIFSFVSGGSVSIFIEETGQKTGGTGVTSDHGSSKLRLGFL